MACGRALCSDGIDGLAGLIRSACIALSGVWIGIILHRWILMAFWEHVDVIYFRERETIGVSQSASLNLSGHPLLQQGHLKSFSLHPHAITPTSSKHYCLILYCNTAP